MMKMKDTARSGWRHAAIAVFLVAVLASSASADMYSGSLSYSDGLYAQGAWASSDTKIEWWVTDYSTYWHYKYTLTVAAQNISHLIIEVSPSFLQADAWSVTPGFSNGGLGTYSKENGNPQMPSAFLGLKWDFGTGTTLTVEFDSDRVPVWGDFYAKDGKEPHTDIVNLAYNRGFSASDTDPTEPIRNGSVDNHLLVPDTYVVPAPEAVVLGSLGLAFAGWLRRRKMMS